MNWLRRFMYGRYGGDQLNMALVGLYLFLWLLSALFRSGVISFLATLLIIVILWRMLSRKIDKRRAENLKFLNAVTPLVRRFNVWCSRRKDREHAYFKCPGCGQRLRAPKGKGKISVTCRSCGSTFEKKT